MPVPTSTRKRNKRRSSSHASLSSITSGHFLTDEKLAAATESVVSDDNTYSQAKSLRGDRAQAMADNIHRFLVEQRSIQNQLSPGSTLTEKCTNILRKLVEEADVMPSQLMLQNIVDISHHPVADGGFADVYKAKLNGADVALKRCRIFVSDKDELGSRKLKIWRREITTWSYLSHKNILELKGVFRFEEDYPFYAMVSSWMSNGTLTSYLTNEKHASCNRLILIHDVLEALTYLHSLGVSHGDMKADNILVDHNETIKLSDLGLSSKKWNVTTTLSTGLEHGSARWMAPERLTGESASKRTPESDVWSLAMTILEILTGHYPYFGDSDLMAVLNINGKKLPTRPGTEITERGLTDSLWGLMNRCWDYCPKDRPTAAFMAGELRSLSQSFKPTAWTLLSKNISIPQSILPVITAKSEDMKFEIKHDPRLPMKITDDGSIIVTIRGTADSVALAQKEIQLLLKNPPPSLRQVITCNIVKAYYGPMIGFKRRRISPLEKKYGVNVIFPQKQSASDTVQIFGYNMEKMLQAQKCLKDIEHLMKEHTSEVDRLEKSIFIPSHIAPVVRDHSEELYHSPLQELDVDLVSGKIVLSGPREGVIKAERHIRMIEQKVEQKTEEVSINSFIYDLLKSDTKQQYWLEIVKRSIGCDPCPYFLKLLPDKVVVYGRPASVILIRNELERLMSIGHSHVVGKRISSSLQKSLLDDRGRLVDNLEARLGVAVYLPSSSAYGNIRMPNNVHRYIPDVPPEEIVKLVGGTQEVCNEARNILEEWITIQLEKSIPSKYDIPEVLCSALRLKIEKRFSGAVTVDIGSAPTPATQSLTSFLGDITKFDSGWSIYERDSNIPFVTSTIRLVANTTEHLIDAGKYLRELIESLTWRIGVFQLELVHKFNMRTLDLLNEEHENLHFEGQESSRQVIITGSRTKDVYIGIQQIQRILLTSQ